MKTKDKSISDSQPKKVEDKPKIVEEAKQGIKSPASPVTYEEHLDAGWASPSQSEGLQKSGKKVIEIKNVDGETLHRLE